MEPLTLRETRTYGALAVAAALVASTGLGAVTLPVVGAVAALATVTASLASVRLFVTCPG